jgi:twitching motility protein PilT
MQLSIALQGIITQQLLPTSDGTGRVVATEVLVPTPAIRNLIREGKTHQIYSAIQTSGSVGMQTMDSNLAQLVRAGTITRQIAEQRASVPEELKRLLGGVESMGAAPAPGPVRVAEEAGGWGPSPSAPSTSPGSQLAGRSTHPRRRRSPSSCASAG